MTSVLPPNAPPASGVQAPPQPGSAPSGQGRKVNYPLIFGVTSVAITLVAIALALVGPLFASVSDPFSDGWTKVYDSESQPFNASVWDQTNGCSITSDGLYASSRAECTFKPSQTTDLTSRGFVIDATVAPPSAVESEQRPAIYIGDSVFVGIDQLGSFALCVETCASSNTQGDGANVALGTADDWHAATNVENTITVRVIVGESAKTLQFFTNGQYTASLDISSVTLTSATVALGADDSSEALFTRAAVYSANG